MCVCMHVLWELFVSLLYDERTTAMVPYHIIRNDEEECRRYERDFCVWEREKNEIWTPAETAPMRRTDAIGTTDHWHEIFFLLLVASFGCRAPASIYEIKTIYKWMNGFRVVVWHCYFVDFVSWLIVHACLPACLLCYCLYSGSNHFALTSHHIHIYFLIFCDFSKHAHPWWIVPFAIPPSLVIGSIDHRPSHPR